MQRLLVSVRGPHEALAAAKGGAHIADVEYPVSALGTPYPLNIKAVRDSLDSAGLRDLPISTNIGEEPHVRSTACQAALGVALAGADYVKCGFAGLDLEATMHLGRSIVRSVGQWFPACKVYPAVFPEEEFRSLFDPLIEGPTLVGELDCAGLLIDTYHKAIGKGLLDYYELGQLKEFIDSIHSEGRELWLAGGLRKDDLPALWNLNPDVLCVRQAACEGGGHDGRLGRVTTSAVADLVATIPR